MSAPKPPVFDAWPVYKRLISYAFPHWKTFALALVCMVLFAGTEVAVARMIKPLTDGSFVDRDPVIIRWMPWAILGIFLLRGIVGFTSSYAMASVGQQVVSKLRQQVFNHILKLPVAYHDRTRAADLQAKLTYNTGQIAEVTSSVLTTLIKGVFTAIGLMGLMIYTSPRLTLFALVVAPLVSIVIKWVNRRFRLISSRIQTSVGGITHSAEEAIAGRRVIKIYGAENQAASEFAHLDTDLRRQTVKMTAASAASHGSMEMIAAIAIALLVALATTPDMLKTMTPGTFVSFIGALLLMRQPLSSLTQLSEKIQRGLVAGADLLDFLDTPLEARWAGPRVTCASRPCTLPTARARARRSPA